MISAAVHSVASFFVSRVDTEVDHRLEQIGGEDALALRGRAAVAQARLAYQMFRNRFAGPRWEKLAARGARVQPPLWASTSTKNPDYPDTLYVDSLIGPDTINTMAEATITAFEDHGTVARTVDTGIEQADTSHARLDGRWESTWMTSGTPSKTTASPASTSRSPICWSHWTPRHDGWRSNDRRSATAHNSRGNRRCQWARRHADDPRSLQCSTATRFGRRARARNAPKTGIGHT